MRPVVRSKVSTCIEAQLLVSQPSYVTSVTKVAIHVASWQYQYFRGHVFILAPLQKSKNQWNKKDQCHSRTIFNWTGCFEKTLWHYLLVTCHLILDISLHELHRLWHYLQLVMLFIYADFIVIFSMLLTIGFSFICDIFCLTCSRLCVRAQRRISMGLTPLLNMSQADVYN